MNYRKISAKTIPEFDQSFRRQGIRYLCGIDEAGRGPLAGPVVAAAVIFTNDAVIDGINDSKMITDSKRRRLVPEIKKAAISWAVAMADVNEIDEKNIVQATFLAMKRAVDQLSVEPDYILVDGRDFPGFFSGNSHTSIAGQQVVKGDSTSQSIAAASILAKVYRDDLMDHYSQLYPVYGFEKHKGYASVFHREKIKEYGPCPLHREKFIRNVLREKEAQHGIFE